MVMGENNARDRVIGHNLEYFLFNLTTYLHVAVDIVWCWYNIIHDSNFKITADQSHSSKFVHL